MKVWGVGVIILTLWCVSIGAENFFQDVKIDREKKIYQEYDGPVIKKTERIYYANDGKLFKVTHVLQLLNRETGIGSNAVFLVKSGDFSTVNEFNARVIKKDGKIVKMVEKHIFPVYSGLSTGYSSEKLQIVDMNPEVEEGDCFEWFTVEHLTKPQLGDFIQLNANSYIEDYSLSIEIPSEYELKYLFTNKNGDDFNVTTANGMSIYSFNVKDSIPYYKNIQTVMLQFPFYFLYDKKITLSTWEEFGLWINEITVDKMKVTPEIQKLSEELTKGVSTKREKIEKVYDHVRHKIRYVQAYIKDGGFVPHTAESILNNGYGDCKDYSVLLITMLKALNIEAYYTLVLSDSNAWNTDKIIASQFNHAIVYIPDPQGDMWLDGTSNALIIGEAPESITNKYAFILGEYTVPAKNMDKEKEKPELYHGLVVVKKKEETESKKYYSVKNQKMVFIEPNNNNSFTMKVNVKSVINNTASANCEMIFTHQYTQQFEMVRKYLSEDNFKKILKQQVMQYLNPSVVFDNIHYQFKDNKSYIFFNASIYNMVNIIGNTLFLNVPKVSSLFSESDIISFSDVYSYPINSKKPIRGAFSITFDPTLYKVGAVLARKRTTEFGSFDIKNNQGSIEFFCNFDLKTNYITHDNAFDYLLKYKKFYDEYSHIQALFTIKE